MSELMVLEQSALPHRPRQQQGRRMRPRAWNVYVVVAFTFASGAFVRMIQPTSSATDQQSGSMTYLWMALYSVPLVSMMTSRQVAAATFRVLRAASALVTFSLLAIASGGWSPIRMISAEKGVALLLTVIAASWLCATARNADDLLGAVLLAGVLVGGVSLVQSLYDPAAFDTVAGGLRGVFSHKNELGRTMGISITAWMVLVARGRRSTLVALQGTVLIVALIQSRSVTSMVAVLVALVASLIVTAAQRHREYGFVAAIWAAATAVATLTIVGLSSLTGLVAKGSDLSGRTDIWRAVLHSVGGPNLVGTGYFAFWQSSPLAQLVLDQLPFSTPNSHNGWIDIYLDLGLLGLVLGVLVIYEWLRRRPHARLCGGLLGSTAFLVFFLVQNVTESGLFQPNTLFVFIATMCLAVTRPGTGGES